MPAVQFAHGIASGDPLSDRVIWWTHAQFSGFNDDVPLTWEVASDAAFTMLAVQNVEIELVLQTRGPAHIAELLQRLRDAGLQAEVV